jgi:CheY-like chemotaxis protein
MKSLKVLVVDDIFANRLLLSEIIQDLGFECVEASNGKEAVDELEKIDFDVVLMDIEMPVMNGIETVRHIRNNMGSPKNQVPIIALTAHNPSLFFDDYSDVGFTNLLTKPYSIDKITGILQSVS